MTPRKLLSRGTALVDARAAVERLRSFQLAEPGLYVLEIVRAAVAGGATAVDLYNDADDLVLTFDGAAPPADDLAHLLDHLFSAHQPRLRLLAIAVNTALGLGPSRVDLYTTHDAPPGQCHRVRFTAGTAHDPAARVPAALESARVELVARPPDLPPEGVRVHLRESFGMPVVREWFARDPAETVLLRDRLVALSIPLRRDGAALATGPALAPLASVALDLGADLRGSLQLLAPHEPGRLVLSELGVTLEDRPLSPASEANVPELPLRLHVDARSLPTNASRSQVDLSGGLQHALRRAWNQRLPELLAAVGARLDDPALPPAERLALHESLLACLHHGLGNEWPRRGFRSLGDDEAEVGHLPPATVRELATWPLVPTATGAHVSLDLFIDDRTPTLAWRHAEPVTVHLAPWVAEVLWCPPKRPRLEALLAPLSLGSADAAIDTAREACARRQRFLGLTPRAPEIAKADDAVLRAPFGGDSTDERPTLAVAVEGLRGELVLRPRGLRAPGAMRVTSFVEQRPLATESLDTAGVPVEVALEAPSLWADAHFQGVQRGPVLTAALTAVKVALAEALAVLADDLAGALSVGDPRRQWFGPEFDGLDDDTRRAMARAAFDTLRGAATEPAERHRLCAELLDRHPALADLPLWPTTDRAVRVSTRAVRDSAIDGAVLVTSTAKGSRADERTVLRLDPAEAQALLAVLDPIGRFANVTATTPTVVTPDPRSLLSLDDRRGVPWTLVTTEHTRVALAPSPSTKYTSVLAHSGRVVKGPAFGGRFGPLQLVVEDDRLVVADGDALLPASVPPDLGELVTAAEITLATRVALAWQRDEEARDALDVDDRDLHAAPARRFLLGALAHVRGRPEVDALQELRAALEATPMIPVRSPDGAVRGITPVALRARVAESGTELPFLADAPDGLDGDPFAPLIVPEREHRTLIERIFNVKLKTAHERLPALREARARRLARARLAGRPTVVADQLAGFACGSSSRSLTRQDAGSLHAAVARELASSRVEVVIDGVVAFSIDGEALPFPVVGRFVPDGDAALTGDLDALSDAGRKGFDALLKAMVPVLLEAAVDDGAEAAPDGLAELALRWALSEGTKGLAAHVSLRERLRKVPMWRSPAGGRLSLSDLTLFHPRPGFCRPRTTPWVAPAVGEEPDIPAVVLDGPDDPRALGTLAGEGTVDRTEDIERLQRRRTLRLSGASKVKVPGEAPCAALSVRVEAVAPKLGFGELRLVDDAAVLTLRVEAPGVGPRVMTLPAPFAMEAAVASPDLDPKDLDRSVQSMELGTRLLEMARGLLLRAAGSTEALPEWSDEAQRWMLLTTRNVEGAARGRAVFTDTEGKPMTLADLDAQGSQHRAVGYCTMVPEAPCAPAEAGARAVMLTTRQVGWLETLRKGRDLTASVKTALRALAWDRSPPAARIEALVYEPMRVRLCSPLSGAEGEGEVRWLDDSAAPTTTVAWYRGRRRLGESELELPWPARVAMEVPTLTPNATRTAPVDDLALVQAKQRATTAAMAALRMSLGPIEDQAPWGAVAAHDPKSPVWRAGTARAVGWLWLTSDASPGTLEVMLGELVLKTPARVGGKHPCAAPVAGRLWLRRSVTEPERAELQEALVTWAWRRLLDTWATGPRRGAMDEGVRALLLTRSAVACVLGGDAVKELARGTKLPGTKTSFQQLQTARKEERALRVVPAGDARLDRAYVVPEGRSAWMAVLMAEGMLADRDEPEAAPTATAASAAPKAAVTAPAKESAKQSAKPPVAEPTREAAAPKRPEAAKTASAAREVAWPWATRVEGELRAMGLPDEALHSLAGAEASRGARDAMVDYAASSRTALVQVKHPVVARWLVGDPRRGGVLLAMAVFGVIRRAREDVTSREECAAMDATLETLSKRR